MIGKIIRILAIVALSGFFLALIIFSMSNKPPAGEGVWDEGTTIGSPEAKKHYIQYTDVMCPYCDVYSRLVMEHQDEFEQFIAEHDILYELRVTDFLYEFGAHQTIYSRQSAEAVYCARDEGKFWEYYHAALTALWNDYHSKGIGDSKTSPEITDITDEYWLNIGREIGLSSEFESCYTDHRELEHVIANTGKAYKLVDGGLPYFNFDKKPLGGFDQRWGWDYVLKYLEAGLK
ncbi:thioredoxin domain-containing protein [Candidatus Saccharibacteria bacterium]|nr:thioredoxin domain-containing protein [Candidatus Saccharibacteria bacterium]